MYLFTLISSLIFARASLKRVTEIDSCNRYIADFFPRGIVAQRDLQGARDRVCSSRQFEALCGVKAHRGSQASKLYKNLASF